MPSLGWAAVGFPLVMATLGLGNGATFQLVGRGGGVILRRFALPDGDGEAFDGVGSEAAEAAADGAEAGLGHRQADTEAGIFGFFGLVPELRRLLQLYWKRSAAIWRAR